MADHDAVGQEFPNFPLESIPGDIPDWLVPCPWHNDAMPIWGDESYALGEGGVCLSVDYPDPAMRENGPGEPRFCVWRCTEMCENLGRVFSSDDWQETLAILRGMR